VSACSLTGKLLESRWYARDTTMTGPTCPEISRSLEMSFPQCAADSWSRTTSFTFVHFLATVWSFSDLTFSFCLCVPLFRNLDRVSGSFVFMLEVPRSRFKLSLTKNWNVSNTSRQNSYCNNRTSYNNWTVIGGTLMLMLAAGIAELLSIYIYVVYRYIFLPVRSQLSGSWCFCIF
jgi:hypothetical protein